MGHTKSSIGNEIQYIMTAQEKQASMIRKCHIHALQTNPRHREEGSQNTVTRDQEDNHFPNSKINFCIAYVLFGSG